MSLLVNDGAFALAPGRSHQAAKPVPPPASPVALARINRELEELRFRPLAYWSTGLSYPGDPFRWKATLLGPEDTPYEGGAFLLRIRFPMDYPFQPPKVKMVTKIYHPNLVAGAPVCLDILTSHWTPAVAISDVMLSISALLRDPDLDNPLDRSVAFLYIEAPALFRATARQWTAEHATLQ